MNNNLLKEFFEDINVNFPSHPKLIEGISVYSMPNGLGVQFRGGSEKLILKGQNSSNIWNFLNEDLNGKQTLDEILLNAKKNKLDNFEVAKFLKILHGHHLLESKNIEATKHYTEQNPFLENQKAYYDRIIGLTGFNESSLQVVEKVKNTKILIIANSYLVPVVCYNLYLAGFKEFGIFHFDTNSKTELKDSNYNIITQLDITDIENSEFRNLMNLKLDDYQYVFTAINNPNLHFLHEISRFCNLKNKPVLNMSFIENNYEVGPFFFPNTYTACSTCYSLRKQSYDQNPIYDFLYQNDLNIKKLKSDHHIKGFDLQGFCSVLNIAIMDLKHTVTNLSKTNLVNKIMQVNTINLDIKNYDIIPVLGCPSCSLKI